MMHEPVLIEEVVELLGLRPGEKLLDATVGLGGHAEVLMKRLAPGGLLIGLDWDGGALAEAGRRLAGTAGPGGVEVVLVKRNFAELEQVLDDCEVQQVDAALFDLGVSSAQLDDPARGFSFMREGLLDMRMDRTATVTAAELVNRLPEKPLADLLYNFGEEKESRRIARAVVRARKGRPIETTTELADIVSSAKRARRRRLHPATKTFLALRIAVNGELKNLEKGLDAAFRRLGPGGRLAVISFHSLEDRRVKTRFRDWARKGLAALATKKPVRPSESELRRNPRSRSARLRVLRKNASEVGQAEGGGA